MASECAPLVKTGGLADVIGSLPKALATTGVRVRVLLPEYPDISNLVGSREPALRFENLFGGSAAIHAIHVHDIDLLVLSAPHLYRREGNIYLGPDGQDWPDNHTRFAALSYAGAEIAQSGIAGWKPDIVNLHDWQTGLLPAYLAQSATSVPPTIMTIHNIAYQGLFDSGQLANLQLRSETFTASGAEFYGKIGFLKAGIAFADTITTVSPRYAKELLNPEFGMGLDGLLRARQDDLVGIVNGIDLDTWNPETDPHLVANYSARALKGRQLNKQAIIARFGLRPGTGPLFAVVSRLTQQKGLDLLLDCIPELVAQDARLALLGSGDADLEDGFARASRRYPDSVGVMIGYDEPLSHLLQGGCDAVIVPSRFEPCGLTQLYGLRYGTLPVVAQTGGLADTVIDANEAALAANCATGFQFAPGTAAALNQTLVRVCKLYQNRQIWARMIRRAMRHPVGWDQSATAYHKIYSDLISRS